MGRKIAIVGATPAGFMQLASLVFNRGQYDAWKDDEFTLIHDPDKVYPVMMSGTVPPVFSEISSVINLTRRWLRKYCDATDSLGYKYVGWGNRKDKNANLSFKFETAAHFDVEMFRKAMLDDGGQCFGYGVTIKEEKIDSCLINNTNAMINGVNYDYVIDCCDKEPIYSPHDYASPAFAFTNTALIVEKPVAGDWDFTIEVAAKYGHITGIPLQSKQLWIYFYDNIDRTDTTQEVILQDFATHFPDEDVTSYKTTLINWTPKVSNYVIHPDKGSYIRNGNALVNIEPLTAGHLYLSNIISESINMYLYPMEEGKPLGHASHHHEDLVLRGVYQEILAHVQETYGDVLDLDYTCILALMYQYGSKYDTKFWKDAKKQAQKYLEGPRYLHPAFFPGKVWRDEVLSDKWGDKEYRKLLHSEEMASEADVAGRSRLLPYVLMNDYNAFLEYAHGFGAPYANRFQALDPVDPPEDHGTIGYNYY